MGEKQVQCNFRLPVSDFERLARLKKDTDVSTAAFLRRLVRRELDLFEAGRGEKDRRAST